MGSINFNVDAVGMEDILEYLDAVSLLPQRSKAALEKGAEILCDEAIKKADTAFNSRTGKLKASIRIGRRKKSDRNAIEVGSFYPDAPHAHLVEYGHGGVTEARAHSFLRTAADAVGDQVLDAIMEELKRELD